MKSLSEALRGASQKQNMNFVDENKIYYKDIDELYPNPHNEKFYNRITKENIQDLKQSILTLGGITNPLTVTEHSDGKLYIVSGNRRREAIKQLFEEGLIKDKKVPYKIKIFQNEEDELKTIILLNTQRKKSIFEERNEYIFLFDMFKKEKQIMNISGDTRDYVAKKIGISPVMLQRYLNLDKLAIEIQNAINNQDISFSAGIEFLGVDKDIQIKIFNKLKEENNLKVGAIRLLKKESSKSNTIDNNLSDVNNNLVNTDNAINNTDKDMFIEENNALSDTSNDAGEDMFIEENNALSDTSNDAGEHMQKKNIFEGVISDLKPFIKEDDIHIRENNKSNNSEDNDSSNVKDLSYGKQFWKRQIESFLELIKKDGNDIDVKDKEDCILTGKKLIETLTK
ncbi:ParB/RepB/Spo0J family partition protein [Megamonas funiformis]|uniref:ParB N-terminal domain-containing protein n=1 Tax=Megamonas funiformis TaxID=437897 RepID=A0AAW4U2R4_9FIRM|nr:ParB N-terminal domain-containing protein [Megamonas funiformis]MCB6828815.1 ParB N-terminal domain-containing protein [Megamonas funiformis]